MPFLLKSIENPYIRPLRWTQKIHHQRIFGFVWLQRKKHKGRWKLIWLRSRRRRRTGAMGGHTWRGPHRSFPCLVKATSAQPRSFSTNMALLFLATLIPQRSLMFYKVFLVFSLNIGWDFFFHSLWLDSWVC